ncbi:hypothetical protein MDG893_19934 [Marinobacter algicola DG893]|uniref:Uncharacterized protein n=1 Tax=Marinobacter algicola DG893 TaxID=443152 RepID=A6F0U1_9GAMM|nr:hypothetical protein MDG893_19934 [Marinobacter algicola DG893]
MSFRLANAQKVLSSLLIEDIDDFARILDDRVDTIFNLYSLTISVNRPQ